MSYAIFTIVYGFPLANVEDDNRSSELEDFVDRCPDGVETRYSGSAIQIPAAFGLVLGQFDECDHHIEISSLTLIPTSKQLATFHRLFEALPLEDQHLLNTLGFPRTFFLVSTS